MQLSLTLIDKPFDIQVVKKVGDSGSLLCCNTTWLELIIEFCTFQFLFLPNYDVCINLEAHTVIIQLDADIQVRGDGIIIDDTHKLHRPCKH